MLKEDFKKFCDNIQLDNRDDMETTIKEITKKLNKEYYDLENEENEHMYIVGSVGRNTAKKDTSDLDVIFDLPKEIYSKYNSYETNGQSALLQDVKNVLLERYPNTDIKGDGQVVVIGFTKYTVELVPGFKQNDDKFKYPDSNDGGSWKYTNPFPEIEECEKANKNTAGNFYNMCHMLRAWKNKKGFKFKGLLIDTLVNNFFNENEEYKKIGYEDYLKLTKEMFNYLKDEDEEQSYWLALGSNQQINNDDRGEFIKKAKKAYNKLKDVKEEDDNVNDVLRNLFGRDFPKSEKKKESYSFIRFRNTEEFIEDKYQIDINYNINLDCIVTQNGYRPMSLKEILNEHKFLKPQKQLDFYIKNEKELYKLKPYEICWKVKNEGELAMKKDKIRGQIYKTNQTHQHENSEFRGNHYVEAYIIKNDVCVAKGKIDVPIE